jgi:hypothetical protein
MLSQHIFIQVHCGWNNQLELEQGQHFGEENAPNYGAAILLKCKDTQATSYLARKLKWVI